MEKTIYIPLWIAIIAALPQLISVVGQFILNYRMSKLHSEVKDVKTEINGRMSELIATTAKASHAEGMLAESTKNKEL